MGHLQDRNIVVIREKEFKTVTRHHFVPSRMALMILSFPSTIIPCPFPTPTHTIFFNRKQKLMRTWGPWNTLPCFSRFNCMKCPKEMNSRDRKKMDGILPVENNLEAPKKLNTELPCELGITLLGKFIL